MFNICPNCGAYHVDKEWLAHSPPFDLYRCQSCSESHKIFRPTLTVITGAAGVGKSTLCQTISLDVSEVICVDGDILFVEQFRRNPNEYADHVLRVCKNVGQCRVPIALFGTFFPDQLLRSREARYFSRITFIGVISTGDKIASRLAARPAWREVDDGFIAEQTALNAVFESRQIGKLHLVLDSEELTLAELVNAILVSIVR